MEEIIYNWDGRNGPPVYAGLLYDVVIEAWIDTHKLHIADSTEYNYRKGIPRVKDYFRDVYIQELTAEMVYEFIKTLKAQAYTLASVRLYCKIVSLSIRYAHKMGYIYHNPIDGMSLSKRTRAEIHPFLESEMPLLLAQEAEQWVKDAIVIAFYTGMRPGEIFALKWSDIDLEMGYIMVQRAQSRACSRVRLKEPKTSTGVRRIDIGVTLIGHLSHMERCPGNPYVFPSGDGIGYRVPWNISKRLHRMCTDAGIPARDFRALRHTHATVLLAHGINPKIVQERLGHRYVEITLDVYSYITPTIQQEAVRVLDEIAIL